MLYIVKRYFIRSAEKFLSLLSNILYRHTWVFNFDISFLDQNEIFTPIGFNTQNIKVPH